MDVVDWVSSDSECDSIHNVAAHIYEKQRTQLPKASVHGLRTRLMVEQA